MGGEGVVGVRVSRLQGGRGQYDWWSSGKGVRWVGGWVGGKCKYIILDRGVGTYIGLSPRLSGLMEGGVWAGGGGHGLEVPGVWWSGGGGGVGALRGGRGSWVVGWRLGGGRYEG